ncbi:hypothetical protein IE81DRAFT_2992 [Ceraceosorus guamensis]|uniref:AMMECR1 domain-containing protein n=1 Tax=Ceraceosorus guamensis TaxID=1522189 RepID=A0A316W9T3_9BASI|nr:hypothetical protein IE81DRAFT_2992 [Ceraceosorus guamensis]PWN46284.1 hypothetical protein IE81DRAFT_2992 [Ceraceosorus guamensis]
MTNPSQALPEHCFYCFDVLASDLLEGTSTAKPNFDGGEKEFPIFVTWNTTKDGSTRLRGCIGTFAAKPLAKGLAEYAIISAFEDTRFNPIRERELPTLECGISLLTAFEECSDWQDWQVGLHGIYIHLPMQNGSRHELTATFLPDVIPAQGWNKEEAIDHAIRKAGFGGKIDQKVRESLRVRRYRSEKVSRTYEEWKAWKAARQS